MTTEAMRQAREALAKLIDNIEELIQQSQGVYGLHLNGDPSPWSELGSGGRYEEWIGKPLDEARAALAKLDAELAAQPEPVAWRCFHCGESFTDQEQAKLHFGKSEHDQPACQISIEHVRWLEEQHRRNVEDDTEVLRTLRGLAGEHELLRRRAEEEGYARGLADAKKHPEALGLTAPPPAPQEPVAWYYSGRAYTYRIDALRQCIADGYPRDEAEKKLVPLVAATAQEPVGEVTLEGVVGVKFYENCTFGVDLPVGTKLYTAPPPAPQQQADTLDAKRYRVLREQFDAYHEGQYPGFHFKCTVVLKPDGGVKNVDEWCDAALAAAPTRQEGTP